MTASLPAAVLAESDSGKGGPIGLFVVLLLIIAVYFLYRSMSGHLRRLPEKFPGYNRPGAAPRTGSAPSAGKGEPDNPPNPQRTGAEGDEPGLAEPDGGPTGAS